MAPPATKNFKQTQPITTGLRIICESYPANTCLREILQNGDDAGATEIEYVLDTKSYINGPLLYDALAAYHGPALLVRNNSVFTDEDFSSLSSVGDSRKREDAAATGKFGLGFNSVYHWTDGPWIYSRNWLLMLDPHESWSGETGKPGGPAWDVIENHNCIEMKNHLKTFSSFNLDSSKEINETVIRVPLRTPSQAKTSKIVQREISVDEIKEALKQFGQEMKDGGLLFLKHIRKVILRIDSDVVAQIEILEDDINSLRIRKELPTDFVRLYVQKTSSAVQKDIFKTFELKIRYSAGPTSNTAHYLVQHTMLRSSGDQNLDKWARERKLFPWAAVAAPLNDVSPNSSFQGRLFCALKMPILTNHPVHIHGLWSITPDRSRLSSSGQPEGYEDEATRWNQFMFQHCASSSWANILLHRNQVSWKDEKFSLWPHISFFPVDFWSRLDDWIVDKIISQKLPVWNTSTACVSVDSAVIFKASDENNKYASAFAHITLPAVYLSTSLLDKTQQRARTLSQALIIGSPPVVRNFLQKNSSVIKPDIPSLVLKYCLLDLLNDNAKEGSKSILYSDLKGIPIWPTLSGKLADSEDLLLPRSKDEMTLFTKARSWKTIDIDRVEFTVLKLLWKDIAHLSKLMRFRTLSDLQIDWQAIYPQDGISQSSDFCVKRSVAFDELLGKIWTWICAIKQPTEQLSSGLGRLWLIPLNKHRLRQYLPGEETPLMLIADERGPFYQKMADNISEKDAHAHAPFILDSKSLPEEAIKLFHAQARSVPKFRGACQTEFSPLVSWLATNVKLLLTTSNEQKAKILKDLESLARNLSSVAEIVSANQENLKSLPLYRRVVSESPYHNQNIIMSEIISYKHAIVVPEGLPPIPDIPDIAFYELSNVSEKYLIDTFNLVEDMAFEDLIKNHLLPWVIDNSGKAKDSLINFLFAHPRSRYPSSSWIALIENSPIVPISVSSSNGNKQYRCLKDLIRPRSTFSKLFFEDEEVFPEKEFFREHTLALNACGIKSEPTWPDIIARIQHFSRCRADAELLISKVEYLFNLSVPPDAFSNELTLDVIRNLEWLPGKSVTGSPLVLLSPKSCRGPALSAITDFVLGSTRFSPKAKWMSILGWDERIRRDDLLRQLDVCLANGLHEKVNQILLYLDPSDYSSLNQKPCILGSRKGYRIPQTTFLPNGLLATYPMAPFLDEVDLSFAKQHKKLITTFEMRPQPSLEDILYVLRRLKLSTAFLDESNLRVAISSLKIATQLYKSDDLTDILVPDTENILRELTDIVHGSCNITGPVAKFNFTHPAVSADTIQRLGVENSLARATRLEIEFEDEDEDEYTPGEKLTNIIADTLGRYPVDSTFNEYLANADDCGSSKISWILDECKDGPHRSTKLLTPELEPLQGPALFVYNNGVFSEKDFAGFKDIGCGSKTDDVTSTGMFGRGALSMYHFTDVPMIVSGGSFLILDPQQELLTKNKRYKRKVGIKIPLSTAHRICSDQLVPFDGLCGFSMGMKEYKGTLFRFCFRKSKQTKLKEISTMIDSAETTNLLNRYFQDADKAMLFLRHIKSIDFAIRGDSSPLWSVSADRSESFEDGIFRQIKVDSQQVDKKANSKTWRIGMIDIDHCPTDVVNPGRGAGKVTECGIAACLTDANTPQRVFCTLPTTFSSHLPISFHASFAITGDRKTIPFENVRQDHEITKWNNWLLTDCIAEFYFEFLKDLAPRLGENSFDYWPVSESSGSPVSMSGIVAKAFWEKLVGHDSWQLFPLAGSLSTASMTSSSSPLKTRPGGKIRKLHTTTSLKVAQFEFLPFRYVQLRPLFLDLCPSLVHLPMHLRVDMKKSTAFESANQLGPEMLCDIFRQEVNCQHLSKFLSSINVSTKVMAMEMLLEIVVPPLHENPVALNILSGCRILPRLDGSLGLLVLEDQSNNEWNFIANETEQTLFDFARSSFVDTRLFRPRSSIFEFGKLPSMIEFGKPLQKPRNPITDIKKSSLNVRKLKAADIGILLASPQSPINSTKTKDLDAWLEKFWQYMNESPRKQHDAIPRDLDSKVMNDIILKCGLQDQKLYRVRTGSEWQYISPREFETKPCVVMPGKPKFDVLCSEILDLKVVDRDCVPLTYLHSDFRPENDFIQSFMARLLQAFGIIERQTQISIGVYLTDKLSVESRKTLRGLLFSYVQITKFSAEEKSILRALPIWPCLGGQDSPKPLRFTSAKDGHFCNHAAMLMPWVRDLGTFVNLNGFQLNDDFLNKLDVSLMKVDHVWNHIKGDFPRTLDGWGSKSYQKFIGYIFSHRVLPPTKVAPNGNGVFCMPNSLYDHNDPIFTAAFRKQQKTKFLHADLRLATLRSSWVSLGLRVRRNGENIDSVDFLQCALAIQARNPKIEKSAFDQDAETVAKCLIWDSSSFRNWSNDTWGKLSKVEIFQVADNIHANFGYRQTRMQELAEAKSHRSLEELGRHKDERIIWSQMPFSKNEPVPFVFESLPNKGFIPVEIVLNHLKHLVNIREKVDPADMPEYLKDFQASYAYLQEKFEATRLIKDIQKEKIWVNVDTTEVEKITFDDLDSTLTSASLLCMNCPTDPLPSKVARKFLVPYEKLLKSLGCPSVTQPPRAKASPAPSTLPMDTAMAEIRNLRDQQEFIDIIFEAEGERKPAHKIFMAAVSQYCRAQFMGEWGRQLQQQQKIIRLHDIRYKTLSEMVDFAYTGTVDWPPLADQTDTDEVASRLDDLLDLLQATDMWFLDRLHQIAEDYIIENGALYVRADNVLDVKDLADSARALRLRAHCDAFIAANSHFVTALSQSRSP